ncbi:MAG: multidrug transporter [Ignavibacteriales bacterium CG_4_9_14_3_um_filter_30_11]|nr:MAG: multidrug transporter [Ignavibacteriales bacterium CG_4_9_14_3_um_filter_30_11]
MTISEESRLKNLAEEFSSPFNKKSKELFIILAAGHGKRIKSQTSKMLHKIWGKPTVERVYNAKNLTSNTIVVVGIKAEEVMRTLGKHKNTKYVIQTNQNGTGHAVKVALNILKQNEKFNNVYILPGDVGLIDKKTISTFRSKFINSDSDMMVLTGIFSGASEYNSYGRIVRVKDKNDFGESNGSNKGRVIEILEAKDINALHENKLYNVKFNSSNQAYTKEELINCREYNSGIYAFKFDKLNRLIGKIKSQNVQKEIYITDLIKLFNDNKFSVRAVSPKDQNAIMGFNNKSVLKEMENIARQKIYEKLKDIIEIEDNDDFYIEDSVIEQILKLDKKNIPLDIKIGKGVHIDKGAKLNYNLEFKRRAYIRGNIRFGKNIIVYPNVSLTTYEKQKMTIGNNVMVYDANIIKGMVTIGAGCRIESRVNITGSENLPTKIGKDVLIKGTSYIYGSSIADDTTIIHSVLINKKIKKRGSSVKFYLPEAEGVEEIV